MSALAHAPAPGSRPVDCLASTVVCDDTDALGRDEWLELRRKGIGGSDAPAVVGLSPWASPIALYYDKLGELPEEPDNGHMRRGRLFEDAIAQCFAEESGLAVERWPVMLAHPSRRWMLANVDRFVVDPLTGEPLALLECKMVDLSKADEWADGPPDYVALQVQHYLAVTGLPVAYVAALLGGRSTPPYTVERDDRLIASLIALEEEFWGRVAARRPPPVDGSDASTKALKARFRAAQPESSVELGAEAWELRARREEAKAALDESQRALDELDNEIRFLLGDCEAGVCGGDVVFTWKRSLRQGYTVKPSVVGRLGFPKRRAS